MQMIHSMGEVLLSIEATKASLLSSMSCSMQIADTGICFLLLNFQV